MKPAGQDAAILPKFNMRPFTSTLNMGLIEWINKTYNVLEDLHTRVAPEGMTMAELPNDAIQLYIHHFKQVVKMVEFLRFLNFGGCKMAVVGPLQPGAVHVTYTTPLMARLEDVPSKTRLMGNQTNEQSPPHHGVVQENLDENMLIDDAERNVADDNVICYDGCKKELTKLQVEHQDKVVAYDLLLKDYEAALNVKKGLHDRVDELEEEKKEWESAQEKQAA
uniref:Uncharacterized protein n=1 Tax=Tanacetum cinerariifolium TaxID=118510 RepID=A0A699JU14_TANCI|nr:hypothetical protein [Tanacetum cinerariifolium]